MRCYFEMSVQWLVLVAFVAGLAGGRRTEPAAPDSRSCTTAWGASDREEARARYEFDVVHREYGNHRRVFDSTEAGLGVITLVAVTLMAAYFPDPKTPIERVSEAALGCAAAIGCFGFMLFRGYEPFRTIEFQRDYRGDPVRALQVFVDQMTELDRLSERAVRAKKTCGWMSLSIVTTVEVVTSAVRWHGS